MLILSPVPVMAQQDPLVILLTQLHGLQGATEPAGAITCEFQVVDFNNGLAFSLSTEDGQGISVPVLDQELEKTAGQVVINQGSVSAGHFGFQDLKGYVFAELIVQTEGSFFKVELRSSRKPQNFWGSLKDFLGLNSTKVVCYF